MEYDRVEADVHQFLREYLDRADADGYVLGVSGGLDSAVGAHVAADAVGPENVTGMVLPSAPNDPANMADARDLCRDLGIALHETDIDPLVEAFREGVPHDLDTAAVGNVRARVRMVLFYEEANARGLLVLGADNKSELELGYFTKYGDGAVDVAPFGDLYKTEMYEFAEHVGVDETFVEKTPTAELWAGQTDEGELGATYDTIDAILERYLERGMTVAEIVEDTGIDRETVEAFVDLYDATRHKRARPPSPDLRD